jgi:hypothetical protein
MQTVTMGGVLFVVFLLYFLHFSSRVSMYSRFLHLLTSDMKGNDNSMTISSCITSNG